MGLKKQEPKPEVAEQGLAWLAILAQIDSANSQSEWVSTADLPRASFHKHPWSIGGGGAAELKEELEDEAETTVGKLAGEMGVFGMTNADDVMLAHEKDFLRRSVARAVFQPLVVGDLVRNWTTSEADSVLFPYSDGSLRPLSETPSLYRWTWSTRTTLGNRATFSKKTYFAEGRSWWAWHQVALERLQPPLTVTWGEIATHNHFFLHRGGGVFNQTAPLIKLKAAASHEEHVKLVGLLNSSTTCFFLKQICHDKGAGGIGGGIASEVWEHRFSFNSTPVADLPIPARQPSQLSTALVKYSTAMQGQSPAATLASWDGSDPLRQRLASARDLAASHRRQLIAWQEELDWQIYEAFGLVEPAYRVSLPEGEAMDAIPPDGLHLGERAFEIVLARRMAAGEVQTTWFERHGSTPITELPRHWPGAYRELVERRLRRIADDPNIRLIEQPEYKRRWNTEPWDEQFTKAARDWLLARLEGYFFEGSRVCNLDRTFNPAAHGFTAATRPHLVSANQLADVAQTDKWFMEVAENYVGSSGFSVPKLIRELVETESVPFLPVQRYKESGLRKRHDWEHVWDLQRGEDEIDSEEKVGEPGIGDVERLRRQAAATKRKKAELGDIPVPPKYSGADFAKTSYWRLRGKLDVPKERWISYPGTERAGDDSLLIAWAGWDHLQQAQALAEYYLDAKDNQGWQPSRLQPLLAGLADLISWLKQWHSEPDPSLGMGLGDYFAGFLDEQCRTLSLTFEEVNKARFGAAYHE